MSNLTQTWDVLTNLNMPDSIAVDWIAHNIYWSDTGTRAIEVARIDGRWRKVIVANTTEPRSIALYPEQG